MWNVDYFGDLMIIALAHYIGKNILLINTDPGSPPVTVVLGKTKWWFRVKEESDFYNFKVEPHPPKEWWKIWKNETFIKSKYV